MSEDIYREMILDHYRNPRNKGKIEEPDIRINDSNPLCGDEISIDLKVEGDIIKDIKFDGRGCAISQASASMLTEMVSNKPITTIHKGKMAPMIEPRPAEILYCNANVLRPLLIMKFKKLRTMIGIHSFPFGSDAFLKRKKLT